MNGVQNILLYTIGNSDITLFDGTGNSTSRPDKFFETTKQIAETGFEPDPANPRRCLLKGTVAAELKGGAKFNVMAFELQPFNALMDWIESNTQDDIFRIILFATRQSLPDGLASAQGKAHDSDTIHLAKIINAYIRTKGRPCQVDPPEQINGNPSDYMLMADWFGNFTEKKKDLLERSNRIFTQISCGTPAMYTNLARYLMPYCTTVLYLSRTKDGSAAVESKHYYGQFVEHLRQTVNAAAQGLNYKTVKQSLSQSPFRREHSVLALADLGASLAEYDYHRACGLLSGQEAESWPDDLKDKLKGIDHDFWQKARVVFEQIEFLDGCGNEVQALVLLVGLTDSIRNQLLKTTAEIDLDGKRGEEKSQAVEKALVARNLGKPRGDKEDKHRILKWEKENSRHSGDEENRLQHFLGIIHLTMGC